jgi:hypothetical protein
MRSLLRVPMRRWSPCKAGPGSYHDVVAANIPGMPRCSSKAPLSSSCARCVRSISRLRDPGMRPCTRCGSGRSATKLAQKQWAGTESRDCRGRWRGRQRWQSQEMGHGQSCEAAGWEGNQSLGAQAAGCTWRHSDAQRGGGLLAGECCSCCRASGYRGTQRPGGCGGAVEAEARSKAGWRCR